ncbi:MAG: hypothetical protein KKD77_22640 [Gammaproteobacteria bacterium]|nr:hypothetical protein [Gammaproteobacteria bacterium]
MFDVLINKLAEFEETTGRKPTFVYLGREDYIKLKKEIEIQFFDIEFKTFYGYEIVEVLREKHIGVS